MRGWASSYALHCARVTDDIFCTQLHNYVLPVVQGFVQIATFQMPDNDAPGDSSQKKLKIKYTIISRRSKERAGLRYQRRGIDDDGNIANFVETETVAQVKVRSPYKPLWRRT